MSTTHNRPPQLYPYPTTEQVADNDMALFSYDLAYELTQRCPAMLRAQTGEMVTVDQYILMVKMYVGNLANTQGGADAAQIRRAQKFIRQCCEESLGDPYARDRDVQREGNVAMCLIEALPYALVPKPDQLNVVKLVSRALQASPAEKDARRSEAYGAVMALLPSKPPVEEIETYKLPVPQSPIVYL